jgi:hypothetical protein
MFILISTFLNAEIIKNLSSLKFKNISSPFCVASYDLIPVYKQFWAYSYQKPLSLDDKIVLESRL